MALTIKQLNGDASFMLTFEPIDADTSKSSTDDSFRILMDPRLGGPSKPTMPSYRLSTAIPTQDVTNLMQLPEPDVVIISNSRSDHCHQATLRQLPPTGTKTVILAEPAAAKVIRGWKYFDLDKIQVLSRWEDPRVCGQDTVVRIPVAPRAMDGDEGLVTVAYIPQKGKSKGHHSAVGITYRPSSTGPVLYRRPIQSWPVLPPSLSPTYTQRASQHMSMTNVNRSDWQLPHIVIPPLQPIKGLSSSEPSSSPSSSSGASPTQSHASSFTSVRSARSRRSMATLSPHAMNRAVSVIFSPHGISYGSLEQYATSHLLSEAALPLTALLHCFDTVSQPWWLGGNVTSGSQVGQEIAAVLGARVWISTYDGEKDTRGLARRMTRRDKYRTDQVRDLLNGKRAPASLYEGGEGKKKSEKPTEVLALARGEEVTLTSEGVWEEDAEAVKEALVEFDEQEVLENWFGQGFMAKTGLAGPRLVAAG